MVPSPARKTGSVWIAAKRPVQSIPTTRARKRGSIHEEEEEEEEVGLKRRVNEQRLADKEWERKKERERRNGFRLARHR